MKKFLLVVGLVALVFSSAALARPSDDFGFGYSYEESVEESAEIKKSSSSSTSTTTSTTTTTPTTTTTTTTTTTPRPVAPAASGRESEEDNWSVESKEKSESTSTSTSSTTTSTSTTTTKADDNSWEDSPEDIHQSDHHHSVDSDAESVPVPLVFRSGAPLTHAEFNETCGDSESSQRCNPTTMVCSSLTSRCECKDTDFIYVPGSRQCLQVSSRATSYSCTFDDQCRSAFSMGDLAFCDLNTHRCACQTSVNGKEIIRVDDKCVYKKVIGEQCLPNDHAKCQESIPGALCMPRPPSYNATHPGIMVIDENAAHVCWCDGSLVFDPTKPHPDECLPIRNAPGEQCSFDRQCTQGLGPYSRCFVATSSCQCADVVEGKGEAVFYKGTCHPKLRLGDPCEHELQCQASIHENAQCAPHPSYQEHGKVCHCPEGVECDDKGGAAAGPVSGGLLFVMAAHLVLMALGAFTVLN